MSKNNQIKKSDKKFIRREKARIRANFLDFKKQEEMIKELYIKFIISKDIASVPVDSQNIATSLNPKSKALNSKQILNSKFKFIKKDKIKKVSKSK